MVDQRYFWGGVKGKEACTILGSASKQVSNRQNSGVVQRISILASFLGRRAFDHLSVVGSEL